MKVGQKVKVFYNGKYLAEGKVTGEKEGKFVGKVYEVSFIHPEDGSELAGKRSPLFYSNGKAMTLTEYTVK